MSEAFGKYHLFIHKGINNLKIAHNLLFSGFKSEPGFFFFFVKQFTLLELLIRLDSMNSQDQKQENEPKLSYEAVQG